MSDMERHMQLVLDDLRLKLAPIEPTAVFVSYWRFAYERQRIYLCRTLGYDAPWSSDPILRKYRFTNVFRASDRVSQYLINEVQPAAKDLEDMVFRTLLFKFFNKIETWEALTEELGELGVNHFDFQRYDAVLAARQEAGTAIFNNAYILPPGKKAFGYLKKHQNLLALLVQIMEDEFADNLVDAPSLKGVYERLVSYPTIGPFLGFQYAIDLNYSELVPLNESSFVVAGPGAVDGISKCFRSMGGLNAEELIMVITEFQSEAFEILELDFPGLWGRALQPIDCQNLFCEISKYARVGHPEVVGSSGRSQIKQAYHPTGPLPRPCFPKKWDLDVRLEQWFASPDIPTELRAINPMSVNDERATQLEIPAAG